MNKNSLQAKFIFSVAFLIILLGLAVLLVITVIYRQELSAELRHKGFSTGRLLSLNLIDPIMTNNIVNLHQIIQDVKEADKDVAYIFVVNPGGSEVLAHTFDKGFPMDLLKSGFLTPQQDSSIKILDTKEGVIHDIATPILGGTIGTVHIGVSESSIRSVLNKSTLTLSLITLGVLSLGLFVFYFLVNQAVRPIREMTSAAKAIGEGDLTVKVEVTTSDEIGILAETLNQMSDKLFQAYEDLKSAKTQLDRANRLASLGQFTAGIAHEVNNPLGGMLLTARQLLRDPALNSAEREQLEIILRGLMRVESIVKQLLTISDHRPFAPVPASLSELIRESLLLFQHRLDEQSIKVNNELAGRDEEIMAEPVQLQQVFTNVIKNAIDAMPYGGKLTIGSITDNKSIHIRIHDTGKGMDERTMHHIFEPFFTTKEAGKGQGLGLSVSYSIIQRHKGDIKITSCPNEGTAVTIILPNA
ncbi:MAG: HAMP domain-containing protein [Planctomycetes bacterium]|nr:HAMP domain-containing protein [Planctomycetota bacterium]